MSVISYGYITWTSENCSKKSNIRATQGCGMLFWIDLESSSQHNISMSGHLPPVLQIIQVKWARHAGCSRRSRDKLIRKVLLYTTTQKYTNISWAAKTYIHQPCADTGYCLEDLPRESQGNSSNQLDLMMIMMIYVYI